jgi:hypothetical protein
MSYDLPTNTWLSVPNTWKPNNITDSICRKLCFYHFRPAGWKVEVAAHSGPHENETFIVHPGQVSLILNVLPGFFQCITAVSAYAGKPGQRFTAQEYAGLQALGQAKFWHLSTENLFHGAYEIFNGPNPLDLAGART